MGEYLGFLVTASAVVALGGLMSHGGRSQGMVKLALGVMLLSVSIVPLISAVTDAVDDARLIFSESAPPDDASGSLYEKTAEDAFCEGIKKLAVSEFSVHASDVDVRVFGFKVSEMRADKVKIMLSGSAVHADYRSLSSRIEALGLGECEVELEIS